MSAKDVCTLRPEAATRSVFCTYLVREISLYRGKVREFLKVIFVAVLFHLMYNVCPP